LQHERLYDVDESNEYVKMNETKLLSVEKSIYNKVIYAVTAQEGDFFFLDVSGRIWKPFFISLILAEVHPK